jgi:hypothetical protein
MARRIIIKNETNWSTRDLRRFVVQCASRHFDKNQLPVLRVTFRRGRHSGSQCTGNAYLGGTRINIFLSAKTHAGEVTDYRPDKSDLAFTLVHEMGHCLGLNHSDMRGSAKFSQYARGWEGYYSWAKELPLERITIKVKPVLSLTDKAQKKLAHAQNMIKKWESKLKSAQTRIKTWSKKAKQYEKKLNVSSS